MTTKPYRPRALQGLIFRGSDAIAEGLLTPNQLRSSAWLRLGRDTYADSRVDRTHELRLQAAAQWLPGEAAFAGPSAAVLRGVAPAAGFDDPVHVVVPAGVRLRSRNGMRVHQVSLLPDDVTTARGMACTSAIRTAWDLACWQPPLVAVPLLDQLLRSGAADPAELSAYIGARERDRGWRLAHTAAGLADGRAESLPESRLRVRFVLAGLPRPECQHPVPVGRITVHPDLAWPEFRVAVEYDGVWHADAAQLSLDRRRLNLLVLAGWTVLHATADRMGKGWPVFLRETTSALRGNGWPG